jgi:hypothetical protein
MKKDMRTNMGTMLSSASDERTEQESARPNIRPSRRARSSSADEESATGTRFFLSKTGTSGNPLELGREFTSEGEARVEALRQGVTYYVVREWRPVADLAGKNPELKREAVSRKESR